MSTIGHLARLWTVKQKARLLEQKKILLIDDNPSVAAALEVAFRIAGYRLDIANSIEETLLQRARHSYDAIILDLNLTAGKSDGHEGLAILARIMTDDPAACVIVLTAHGGIGMAVATMKAGARDFVVKPWSNSSLIKKVETAISQLGPRAESCFASYPGGEGITELLGESPLMTHMRSNLRRIAPTSAGVMITGPSGAGRTLTAMVLHRTSKNACKPPLSIDFREVGASEKLAGAEGNIILRFPELLGEFSQDSLSRSLLPNIRPISIVNDSTALTPNLRRRIATVEIRVPSLSERRGDIPLLARHFVRVAAARFDLPEPVLTEAAKTAISSKDWPDEVRGLALTMERALLLAVDGQIERAHLGLDQKEDLHKSDHIELPSLSFDLQENEKSLVEAALREHGHNISRAAQALGLSRGALYRRMERYGL